MNQTNAPEDKPDLRSTGGRRHGTFSIPHFVVGCVLLAAAIGFGIWGFSRPNLSRTQWQILQAFVALGAGFAAAAFSGAARARSSGIIPGLVVTATGGFAVWLIMFFGMSYPEEKTGTFSVKIVVHRGDDTGDRQGLDGRIVFDMPRVQAAAITDGEAILTYVPNHLKSKETGFALSVKGYVPAKPRRLLLSDDVQYISVKPASTSDSSLGASPCVRKERKPATLYVTTNKNENWKDRGGDGHGGNLLSYDIVAPGAITAVRPKLCAGCGAHFWPCPDPRCSGRGTFD
jgi:hypothetical protein